MSNLKERLLGDESEEMWGPTDDQDEEGMALAPMGSAGTAIALERHSSVLSRRRSNVSGGEPDLRKTGRGGWWLLDEAQVRHKLPQKTRAANADKISEYESFDYNTVENELRREGREAVSNERLRWMLDDEHRVAVLRWMFCFTIAVAMGFTGFFTDMLIYYLGDLKYNIMFNALAGACRHEHGNDNLACRASSWFIGIVVNVSLVLAASYVCNRLSLASAGSGIGEIKSYLNGIRRRDWLSMNTFVSKVFGVVCGVTAGMPIGKEGPMIHTGAILGAGISQAKNKNSGVDLGFDIFRNDRDKRDFVAAGAAAGLCCAFGAPIGGVLFVLEEGASFLHQSMIWRCLFTAVVALFVLQLLETGTFKRDGKQWGDLTSNAMFSFGRFTEPNEDCGPSAGIDYIPCRWAPAIPLWTLSDLPMFLVMAILGGLLGALFNQIQSYITVLRMQYRTSSRRRIIEAGTIAFVNTTLLYLTAQYVNTCKPKPGSNATAPWLLNNLRQATCPPDEYSSLATLVFNPLEVAVQEFFHEVPGTFDVTSCLTFGVVTYFMACWTYGGAYPSGIFVPSIAIGAAFGRAFGQGLLGSPYTPTNVGVYALMGAGAFLSGVTRVTISLAAIFVESTAETTILLPLAMTLIVSKWVSDRFNRGIYDMHINMKETPVLEWHASIDYDRYRVKDAMSTPVASLPARPAVRDVVELLRSTQHSGFPVVSTADGTFVGMILRHQLLTLLEHNAWERPDGMSREVTEDMFRRSHPKRRTVDAIAIPEEALDAPLPLALYFDATVFTVLPDAPLSRAFQIVRYLGLRHLPVVDGSKRLVGMITRHNVLESTVEKLNERYFPQQHGRRSSWR